MLLVRRTIQLFNAPWLRAAGVLFSTIVGAGMLSIPFVVAQVGIVVGLFYIVGMGLIMCVVHLLLAELVIKTPHHLQLTGLMRKYLGPVGMWIMATVFFLLHVSAMIAYLIGEGDSLSVLFGGRPFAWAILFFIFGTTIILRGVRVITDFDAIMTIVTTVVIVVLIMLSVPSANLEFYAPKQLASLLLPYGVLLFAFHGTSAIPELEIITGRDPRALRLAVLVGSLVPIVLYVGFAAAVVAVTGVNTTEIATIGLGAAVGPRVVLIGNIFAVVAMSSSFVTIGEALRRTFQWDFGFKPNTALAFAVGIPLIIYIVGARGFISVIAIAGATCGTTEIFLLICAYWKAHHHPIYEKNSDSRRRIRGR
ncbi:MAG: hypothetical protein NT003_00410 [Candidatus Magasanikbacteria bacterium]|nr:hypothetical protein [Candidatus Magasanikbacteria bacterium]